MSIAKESKGTDSNSGERNPAKIARTKTVATLGPASLNRPVIEQLIECGVDVFRLNMAHGNREKHQQAIEDIRAASKVVQREVAILVDLAGPKIRLGQMPREPIMIETGSTIRFVREGTDDPLDLTCSYQKLIDDVKVGDLIVLCDGTVRTVVNAKHPDHVQCQVIDGGEIRSRQGVNLPGADLSVNALQEVDRDNAQWAVENGADFVSLSFVRTAEEIEELKGLVDREGGRALVIAKIEKREALENIDSIVQAADGIMVARGDLGVEIEIEKTPLAQKSIIESCRKHAKPVIVATQMLESMRYSKMPTRAEATDVANAILDGADACMLSGETAIGDYPLDAVSTMQKIMVETEQLFRGKPSELTEFDADDCQVSQAILQAAANIARKVDAKLVAVATNNGDAALAKSKQRDFIPTIALTNSLETLRRMNLFWGITPLFFEGMGKSNQGVIPYVQKWVQQQNALSKGDRMVFVVDTELWPGVNDMVLVAEHSQPDA